MGGNHYTNPMGSTDDYSHIIVFSIVGIIAFFAGIIMIFYICRRRVEKYCSWGKGNYQANITYNHHGSEQATSGEGRVVADFQLPNSSNTGSQLSVSPETLLQPLSHPPTDVASTDPQPHLTDPHPNTGVVLSVLKSQFDPQGTEKSLRRRCITPEEEVSKQPSGRAQDYWDVENPQETASLDSGLGSGNKEAATQDKDAICDSWMRQRRSAGHKGNAADLGPRVTLVDENKKRSKKQDNVSKESENEKEIQNSQLKQESLNMEEEKHYEDNDAKTVNVMNECLGAIPKGGNEQPNKEQEDIQAGSNINVGEKEEV